MLFVKRLLTALVLLSVFFVVSRTGALIVGGAVIGARIGTQQQAAGVHDYNATVKLGAQAGQQFAADNGQVIGLAALAMATVGALWLTFGGVLSWCREPASEPLRRSPYG